MNNWEDLTICNDTEKNKIVFLERIVFGEIFLILLFSVCITKKENFHIIK